MRHQSPQSHRCADETNTAPFRILPSDGSRPSSQRTADEIRNHINRIQAIDRIGFNQEIIRLVHNVAGLHAQINENYAQNQSPIGFATEISKRPTSQKND